MNSILIKNTNSIKNVKSNVSINKNIIIYQDTVHNLLKYSKFNPPFFKKIIIENNDLSDDDLKKLYNMCLIGGRIYFPDKYNKFFKNERMITKQKNYVYPLNNRTIDFIIVGTQRGGTTSLSINISKHPEIFIDNNKNPEKSEIHFYDINWKKGIEWYKKQVKFEKNKNKIIGEKTPDLMYLEYTHPYMHFVNPFLKIIVILRNPVERAYSHWKLNKKNNSENLSFSKAISFELKNLKNQNKTFFTSGYHYINRGFYYQQIKNLLKWFPMDNMLVLISEDVKNNMNKSYNKLYNFLQIHELDNVNYELEHISKNKSKINPLLYNKLMNIFKKDILSLEKLLNIKTNWI